jgi:hypothetical protein
VCSDDVAQNQRHEEAEGAVKPLLQKRVGAPRNEIDDVDKKQSERAKYSQDIAILHESPPSLSCAYHRAYSGDILLKTCRELHPTPTKR